jgi:DNA (cytosine-5)-methyltransferase 1
LLKNWFLDEKLEGVINHQSRAHLLDDLRRYLFAELFSKSEGRFPRLADFDEYHLKLMPDHDNAKSGKFEDRFRVQLPDEPATTVTSHISKDGHYFIHYDPKQCRSLTVREAARVQTFPDNYLFCGARTAQFHQVGNAVPPYLAFQISKIIYKLFKDINDGNSNKYSRSI